MKEALTLERVLEAASEVRAQEAARQAAAAGVVAASRRRGEERVEAVLAAAGERRDGAGAVGGESSGVTAAERSERLAKDILALAVRAAAYDEAKHPRGHGGQWTGKAGGTE